MLIKPYFPIQNEKIVSESFVSGINTFSTNQLYEEILDLLKGGNAENIYRSQVEKVNYHTKLRSYCPAFTIKPSYLEVFHLSVVDLGQINHVLETAALFGTIHEKCMSTEINLKDSVAVVFNNQIIEHCVQGYLCELPTEVNIDALTQFSLLWQGRIDYSLQLFLKLHEKAGMHILNDVYIEFTMKIKNTWESNTLQLILDALYCKFSLQLQDWLLYGTLPVHNKQWMFSKRSEIPDCRKWREWVYPKFKLFPVSLKYMDDVFNELLSIGKAQLFLQESNYTTKFKENVKLMQESTSVLNNPRIFYEIKERAHFSSTIRKIHLIANKFIVDNLMKEDRFMEHWEIIKSYLLLTNYKISDGVVTNLEKCLNITEDNIIFDLSNLMGNQSDFFSQKVRPAFTTLVYTNPHSSIMSKNVTFFIPNLNFCIMEPVSINFKASLSISIIINESHLNSFQKIFKLTISLASICKAYDEVYDDIRNGCREVRRTNDIYSDDYPMFRLMMHFRRAYSWLNLFLRRCHYHVFGYIIPLHTNAFEKEIKTQQSMDDLITLFSNFLRQLKEDLFLDDKSRNAFMSILEALCFCNDFLGLLKNTLARIGFASSSLSPVEIVSTEREITSYLSIFLGKLDVIADNIIKECPSGLFNGERKNFYAMIGQVISQKTLY
uniref:GCP_C_terminal domain-containing protein n=1 Tax=Rhabditophanes sp. KR3021 TaxID=114890 RepID=A0AC35TIH8_9BILA